MYMTVAIYILFVDLLRGSIKLIC